MSDRSSYVFFVGNKHAQGGGEPPSIDGNIRNMYYGYYENEHHEQFVFVFDYSDKTAKLWVGDARWDIEYQVVDGKCSDLILSENEKKWLQLCWDTATTFVSE